MAPADPVDPDAHSGAPGADPERYPGARSKLPPLPVDAEVAVVIPARGSAGTLAAAVASVLTQRPAPVEVVIAVGPSSDATERIAADLAATDDRIRVVTNPSGRTPDALNLAIATTSAEVVARVDAHAVLPPGYLDTAVAALRRTGAANVGGRQVPVAPSGFARCVAAAMASPAGAGGAAYRTATDPGPVDTVYLGVFRRAALDAVGGFDRRFTRNQDAELNLRLRAAGHEVWLEPALQVSYRPRGTVRSLATQYAQYGRWRRFTARTHPGSLAPRQLAAPAAVAAIVGGALASAATGSRWPAALAAGGYLAAITAGGAHAAPDLRSFPGTVLALATMHLSWGAGFLLGPPRDAGTAR